MWKIVFFFWIVHYWLVWAGVTLCCKFEPLQSSKVNWWCVWFLSITDWSSEDYILWQTGLHDLVAMQLFVSLLLSRQHAPRRSSSVRISRAFRLDGVATVKWTVQSAVWARMNRAVTVSHALAKIWHRDKLLKIVMTALVGWAHCVREGSSHKFAFFLPNVMHFK